MKSTVHGQAAGESLVGSVQSPARYIISQASTGSIPVHVEEKSVPDLLFHVMITSHVI